MHDPITLPAGQRASKNLAYWGLVIAMLIWAVVPVFLKKLLEVLSPTEISFSRFFGSGLLLLVWVSLKRRGELVRIFGQDLRLMLLGTVFGPLTAMVCLNFALVTITVGTSSLLSALEPVFTYLLAVLIGQEAWKTQRLFSILLALAGIVLVMLSHHEWGAGYWPGLILATLTPMVWAANSIITAELVKRHAPLVIMSFSFVLSSLFLIPTLSAGFSSRLMGLGWMLGWALAFCIMSNIFGFIVWYVCLKYLPPSSLAMTVYVIPIFSVAAGMAFLDEPMSWLKGLGIATVLLGLYLVNVRFR
jgi:drug/metabolite transporter (DMT)-like permease